MTVENQTEQLAADYQKLPCVLPVGLCLHMGESVQTNGVQGGLVFRLSATINKDEETKQRTV